MTTVGHAQFDITGNNTQAIRAIQQIRAEALKQLGNLTIGVNAGSIGPAIQAAVKGAQAQVAVTLKPITQAQVDAALGKAQGSKQIDVSLAGDALTRLAEIKAKLTELKTTTTSMLTVDVSSVERVIQALKQQIVDLRALQSQIPNRPNPNLPGQGGGGGGPPNAGLSQLQRDLQIIQSQYDRGAVGLRTYLREMERIRTAGQGMAAGLQAGSRETQQLERVMKGLSGGTAKINTESITKLRSDLQTVRAEYEKAIGAAGRFNFAGQREATRAYEGELAKLETRIRSIGERATITATQTKSLTAISQQIASQQNALNGVFSGVGLGGTLSNALKSLPQFAAQMGGSLGAAFSGVQQLTGGLGAMGAAAGPAGVALGAVVAVLAGLVAGLGSAVNTAGQFQQTMVNLKALTQPTSAEFARLSETAMNIGVGMGVGPREAAAALLELNKAGLPTESILKGGAEAALTLAGAAGITADQAAKLAVAAQTAFGIAASDMPKIADVFANFANKTFLGAEDLQQALAAVGPVAKAAGLSLEQFSGYMATLAQGGFKNMSDAGTSLKTMLLALQAPSSTAADALERLQKASGISVSFYDAAGAGRPLADVLASLKQAMQGMSEEQQKGYLKDIFGTDAIRAGLILLEQGNAKIEENIKAMGLQGEAARVARERNESFQGQLRILKATWEQLTIMIGQKFLPVLTDVVRGITNFLNEIKNSGPVVNELKGYIGALAIALLGVKAAAIGAFASSLWAGFGAGAVAGLRALPPLITLIGGLLRGLLTLIGGLPGAVAAAVAALAVYSTRLIADTQRAYDAADKSNNDSTQMVLDRVRKLRQEGTELATAQAKYLLALERKSQADQGRITSVKWTGERIVTVDPEEQRRANEALAQTARELDAAKRQASLLAAEDARRGEVAKQAGYQTSAALKLTEDQLKKQASTVKDLRSELGKPLKVFGGTEFQNQIVQIGERFKELRQKLYENVLDPKVLKPLKDQLAAREQQERGNVRTEFQTKAGETAADAERKVQAARVSAMQEGSAKILAQAQLDVAEMRRTALESAKAWRDFPKEKARIIAAGEAQVRQILAQATQKAGEADQKVLSAAERAVQKARVDAMKDGSAKVLANAKMEAQNVWDGVLEQIKAYGFLSKERARLLALGTEQVKMILTKGQQDAAEADRKAAKEKADEAQQQLRERQAIEKMGRQFFNLNQDGLKWSQGSVTAQQLQDYQQAVAGLRSEVEKLPQDQQDRFKGLFGQAAELDRRGQALVSIKDQIKEVTDRLGQMTVAELQNARAQWASVPAAEALIKAIDKRLPLQQNAEYKASLTSLQNALADMSDAELQNRLAAEKGSDAQGKRIKLLETEIETRRKLRDTTLEQGRLTLQKNDAQAVVDDYEAKRNAAQGNNQKLLELERTMGAEVLAARQRLAQIAAREEILQIEEKYRALIEAAQKHGQAVTELESQRDALIQQARDRRNATQLVNAQQSDKALIDQTKTTTAELLKLEGERQDGIASISRGRSENQVSGYDLVSNQAGDDLQKRLQVEQDYGQQVIAARENIARLAAQAEIRQQTAAYQTRIDAAEGNADEQKRLEDELAAWISNRNIALGVELEGIALDVKNKRIAAEETLKNAILQINRDLLDGLNQRAQSEAGRKTSQFETDLQQELRAVGDNEQAKLDILIREQGVRILLAQQEINARMTSEREAENRRFEDLRTRLQKEGTWAQNSQRLEADHQARLTEIATQGEFDKGQKVLAIRTQTEDQAGKVQEKRAQDQVRAITKGLNDMTVEQRAAATTSLQGWLDTFSKMGVAGQAAAKVIQAALDQVAQANDDAVKRAGELADKLFPKGEDGRFANPETVRQTLAARTNKIGKADTKDDAIAKGEGQYSAEIAALTQGIQDAQAVIDVLGKLPAEKLDAASALKLRMAQQYLLIFQQQLATTKGVAQKAGEDAGNAFVDAQVKELAKLQSEMVKAQDTAADSALQLAEANLKLTQSKGLDGTRDYTTALQAYRDYWKARMGVLQQGLADAQAAENKARADLAGLSATATTEQRTTAQNNLNTAITNTNQAQADLNQATTNYVTGQEKVIDVDQQRIDGQKALRQSQSQLASLLGRTAISYQSELDSLDELIKKYPAQALELGKVRAEYERIQTIRQRGISADSLKLDFKIGFDGGGQRLTDTVSGVAQGLGALTNPLSLLAMVLEKLNIVGTITDALFSALEEPMKALQEPLKILGEILGSLIGANLRTLAPILEAVVTVFAALYDAIAEFINAITFGLYDIRRKDPNDSTSARRELADSKAQNDQTQLGIDYRKGLISFEEYEAGKLKLFKEGLDRQEAADIEAANGNEAKIAEIRRKYAQQWETEQLDSADRVHQHALEGIDEQVKRGLLTEKEGAEKKYALNVEYLNRQRNAAIAAANGDQEKILAINKKYDGLILDSKREMLDKVNAAYKGITDGLMSSVIGGTKDLLMNALKGMNFGAFRQGFRQQFRQALFDAVVSAAIEGAALQGILQPAMDALKEAIASGNEAQIDQALNGVLQAGSKAEAALARIFPRLAKLGQKLGIGTGEQDSTLTVTGQIQAPEVKISLDALAMLADVINERIPKYTDAINLHVPALQASTETLRVQVPAFSSAVDQFGLHEAAYQQQFGANVSAFGGYVSEFGQHVRVLAGAAAATQNAKPLTTTTSGGGYVPVSKR